MNDNLTRSDMFMRNKILNPAMMFFLGLALGIIVRSFDIYTEHLGNMFSQMAIWILIGTIISIYSKTPQKAMFNVFPFCIGMLITYYAVAVLTDGVYGKVFIIGWTAFALCSPIMAFFAWKAKENNVFSKIIGVGIVIVSVLSSVLLFDRLRFYDYIIDAVLIYLLFFKKIQR